MAVKHIYLVRHGETEANKKRIHQAEDESLTQKGKLQAHHVAGVLSPIGIDTLISSSFVRARETAEILASHLTLPITLHESFVEVRRPAHLYGQSYSSLDTVLYFARLYFAREVPKWEYHGAENMFALRNRIEDAKQILAQAEGEHVLAVTHDVFMNLFLVHVCQERKLTLSEYLKVIALTKRTPNTGVIHLTYDNEAHKGTCPWQLVEFVNQSPKH
jgi:probable phosphoglycerate mutase